MSDKEWFFVFVTAPETALCVDAIFPKDKSVEAFDYVNSASGYLTLRIGKWNGGKLPRYNETKAV